MPNSNENILNSDIRLLTKNGFEIDVIGDVVSIRRGKDYAKTNIILQMDLTTGHGYIVLEDNGKHYTNFSYLNADYDKKIVKQSFSFVIPSIQ